MGAIDVWAQIATAQEGLGQGEGLPHIRFDEYLEHDDKKWEPVFVVKSCDHKYLEHDDDSKKSHHALIPDQPNQLFKTWPRVGTDNA